MRIHFLVSYSLPFSRNSEYFNKNFLIISGFYLIVKYELISFEKEYN